MKILAIPVILLVGALLLDSSPNATSASIVEMPVLDGKPIRKQTPLAHAWDMMVWLREHNIPTDTVLDVVIVPNDELAKMIYGGRGGRARGGCFNGVIYLSDKIDLETVEGRSVLLHELVHAGQPRIDGVQCPIPSDLTDREQREKGAYEAQERYLAENGVKYKFDLKASLRR